jgi:hypothetical protein
MSRELETFVRGAFADWPFSVAEVVCVKFSEKVIGT